MRLAEQVHDERRGGGAEGRDHADDERRKLEHEPHGNALPEANHPETEDRQNFEGHVQPGSPTI